ncbi:hypothetical protein F8M41_006056 [Gigaspora margarita]|uniref:Uncharacterized protein n=1 Tax=Gigaspora margarita TaxID=4874 RepID=A0A8H4A5F3_GIGMA|nr:hypothetical protein F8M41_006056 [Gigaspora margarita]
MHLWSNYIKEKTIRLCHEELDTIANDEPATTLSTNEYFASIFQDNHDNNDLTENELDKYIDIKRVTVAPQDKLPLEW